MNTKTYCIKDGYRCRTALRHFDDTINTDKFQRGVYDFALKLCEEAHWKRVIDLGCGSGYKLVNMFPQQEYETIGVDVFETVVYLRKKYPKRTWFECNFEVDTHAAAFPACDLLLCVDVIEHLLDPDLLLRFIAKMDFKLGIISTPERDIYMGEKHNGPPPNSYHVREWNAAEFKSYLGQHFDVRDHHISGKHDQFAIIARRDP